MQLRPINRLHVVILRRSHHRKCISDAGRYKVVKMRESCWLAGPIALFLRGNK